MTSTPTMVRNTHGGPAVFSDGNQHVEWAGAGDIMQNDVQPVPPAFMDNVQFHRMVTRGIFVVETADEDIAGVLAAHRRDWEMRNARAQAASAAAIDMAPDDDSIMKNCLGPSTTGRGKCDQSVPVKVRELASKPPLCTVHAELAPQFVAEEGQEIVGGKPEVIWKHIQVGARARQEI